MSLGTSNRDGGKTSESGHLRTTSKLIRGNVLNGLLASQRAAGVNMSVDISIGDAMIMRSDNTYGHEVFNDAVYNQAVSAADGSNPRRDIIVMYIDYTQAPSTAVSNNTNGVVKIKIVNGTPAGSPVDPTDAAIQSSVVAGNPWFKIARVRVPAGQTSISNSLIDDLRSFAGAKDVPGTVKDFAGPNAPDGYLLCYGQAISRATYNDLFSIIGTAYGVGDGSTTFNLPDLRGRVVAGKDNMGGSAASRLTGQAGGVGGTTLGNNGGAETHVLTVAQMPSHTHSWLSGNGGAAGGGAFTAAINNAGFNTSAPSSYTGGDGAHNNVQPTLILNKIIAY